MPKLARSTGFVTLMLPTVCVPLGLGDVELNSVLNQPLKAAITILDAQSVPMDKISIELASPDEFARLGLDRPHFLSSLKMGVTKGPGEDYIVNITSSQAVKEPFLDLLVAVKWPQGRMIKEYTMLLDPPVFMDEQSKPVALAVNQVVSGQPVQEKPQAARPPVPMTGTASLVQANPALSDPAGSSFKKMQDGSYVYGPVKRSDTLWRIAHGYSESTDLSESQVMLSLLRDNPDAFYHNNVNELKAGYVLRISHPEEIGAVSQKAAYSEIDRQYDEWRARKEGRPLPAQKSNSGPAVGGAHLELASVTGQTNGGSTPGESTDGIGSGRDTTKGMSAEALVALEASDAAQQENIALRERLAALEKQMADMQRLLVLKGDNLAALQANTIENNVDEAAKEPETNPVLATDPGQDAVDTVAITPTNGGEVASDDTRDLFAGPGIIDRLLGEYLLYTASGGLLLALLLALVARRRRSSSEFEPDETPMDAPEPSVQEEDDSADLINAVAEATNAESAVASSPAEKDEAEEAAQSFLDEVSASGFEDDAFEEDEIDTLSEADVYLAYRRFDKAEQLLLDALSQDPDQTDVHLKLLEVYAKSDNKEAFVLRAEALQALLDEDVKEQVWGKVKDMGTPLLGRHPLFGGSPVADYTQGSELKDTEATDEMSSLGEGLQGDVAQSEYTQESAAEPGSVSAFMENEGASTEMDFPEVDFQEEKREAEMTAVADDVSVSSSSEVAPLEFEHAPFQEKQDPFDHAMGQDEHLTKDADPDNSHSMEFDDQPEMKVDVPVLSEEAEDTDNNLEEDEESVSDEMLTDLEAVSVASDSDDDVEGAELAEVSEEDMAWLDEVVDSSTDDILGTGDAKSPSRKNMADLSGPLAGEDHFAINLDLARAYIDMGDLESARSIIEGMGDNFDDGQLAELQELRKLIA